MSDAKPMTGPDHVREALRLAEYAEQENWPLQHGGSYVPSDDERHRMLVRAHLHASLARTAALTDATAWSSWSDVERRSKVQVHRDHETQAAWHELFGVEK